MSCKKAAFVHTRHQPIRAESQAPTLLSRVQSYVESENEQRLQPIEPNILNRSRIELAQTIIRLISNMNNHLAARLSNKDAHQLASALLLGVLRLKLAAAPPEGCNQGGGRGGVPNK